MNNHGAGCFSSINEAFDTKKHVMKVTYLANCGSWKRSICWRGFDSDFAVRDDTAVVRMF